MIIYISVEDFNDLTHVLSLKITCNRRNKDWRIKRKLELSFIHLQCDLQGVLPFDGSAATYARKAAAIRLFLGKFRCRVWQNECPLYP